MTLTRGKLLAQLASTWFTTSDYAALPRTTDGLTLTASDYQPVIDLAARYGVIPKAFPAGEMLTDGFPSL